MQICVCSLFTSHSKKIGPLALTHIHMHPDAVLFADVGNGDEGVEGPVHCRSSRRAHKERYETLRRHNKRKTCWRRRYVSSCLRTVFLAACVALPSVWPPVSSSQGQLGSFYRCEGEEKNPESLGASGAVCEFNSGGRIGHTLFVYFTSWHSTILAISLHRFHIIYRVYVKNLLELLNQRTLCSTKNH